jgi:hypothetical protein
MDKQEVPSKSESEDSIGYFTAYSEYNRILRMWLVGFGIGGILTLISNEKIHQFLDKHELITSANYFAAGISFQVLIVLVNKVHLWCNYYAKEKGSKSKTIKKELQWFFDEMNLISEKFWIDILFDIVTILFYIFALLIVLSGFANNESFISSYKSVVGVASALIIAIVCWKFWSLSSK